MRYLPNSPATLCALVMGCVLPFAAQSAEQIPAACKQIVIACRSAGFVQGDYQKGYGLWTDCVDPIMRGAQPPRQADKQLPTVNPELIATCKQANPNFGMGNKGQAKDEA
jgi:hypothetical protein